MIDIGIFGTSGFAREVGDVAYDLGFRPIYIASDKLAMETWHFSEEVIIESSVEHYSKMCYSIGIGDNSVREKIAKRFLGELEFHTLIHPSASFGAGQRDVIAVQKGVIICAGVRFTNNISVGNFSIFNLNATVGHDVVVEDFVNLAPGVNISGNVILCAGSMIGTGASVNQGSNENKLIIGRGTSIGSGSVVLKDCTANATYVGVPAVKIR